MSDGVSLRWSSALERQLTAPRATAANLFAALVGELMTAS